MKCPKCKVEISENQKFCINCGAKLEKFDIKAWLHQNRWLFIGIIISFIIAVSIILVYFCNLNNTLYKIYDYKNNRTLFINELGKEVLNFPTTSEPQYFGAFREGRLFIAKRIAPVHVLGIEYDLVNLTMIDKNNKTIKSFEKSAVVLLDDSETIASYLPEFYKGYAVIHFLDKSQIPKGNDYVNDVKELPIQTEYIDKNGNTVKNIPEDIKKVLDDEYITANRYKTNDLIYKDMPCENNKQETCVGYVNNKNQTVINPIFDFGHLQCGDWYKESPDFINHVALIKTQDGYYSYIDQYGRFINNKQFQDAYPFYGNLAYVINDNKYGYINKNGNWVYSLPLPPDWYVKDVPTESTNEYYEPPEDVQNGENEKIRKAVEKYKALNFDNDEILKIYKGSLEYCLNQNCETRGEFAQCQEDYYKSQGENISKIINTLETYCFDVKNSSMVDVDKCIEESIKSH